MFDHSQIPPEVFATAFEIGILTWDIQFLPPLRLVCRAWNDIVTTTPRLCGIITIHQEINLERMESQITKAKASLLSIFIRAYTKKPHEKILRMLVELSSNWICAEVPTSLLARCCWSDLYGTLQTLRLTSRGADEDRSKNFFDLAGTSFRGSPCLSSLTTAGLSKDWIILFLSPSIKYFKLCLHEKSIFTHQLTDTLIYLAKIPHILVLKLEGVHYVVDHNLSTDFQHPIHPGRLVTLELDRVLHPSTFLSELSAPSLHSPFVVPQS